MSLCPLQELFLSFPFSVLQAKELEILFPNFFNPLLYPGDEKEELGEGKDVKNEVAAIPLDYTWPQGTRMGSHEMELIHHSLGLTSDPKAVNSVRKGKPQGIPGPPHKIKRKTWPPDDRKDTAAVRLTVLR